MMRANGPSLRSGGVGGRTLRVLAVLALAVLLAGCSADTGGDGTTDGPTASAEAVTEDAIAALEDVEEYRVASNGTFLQRQNNVEQELAIDSTTRVDRPDGEIRATQSTDAGGQTFESDVYLVDGTLYERSQQYVQPYSSEWVKVDVSDNLSGVMRQFDSLRLYREVLANGTATVTGSAEVDGRDVHVVDVVANESALPSYTTPIQGEVTLRTVDATFWVDAETGEVRRLSGNVTQEISAQGGTVEVEGTVDLEFSYDEAVDVSLPPAASDAVDLGNRTARG